MNTLKLEIIPSAVPIADGRLWFSQLQIAAIFNKSLNTINEHISGIKPRKPAGIRRIGITQTEGVRKIHRNISHYDLDFVHSIGIASREYDRLNALLRECKQAGFDTSAYEVVPKREREFFQMVNECLSGICEVSVR